ncbi:CFS1-like protein [Mycena leptocephala]|nr:CFS1-like protein [Mycena leptocephala]
MAATGQPQPLATACLISHRVASAREHILSVLIKVAESFMLGEVKVTNLRTVCYIWLANAAHLDGLSTVFHQVFSSIFKFTSNLLCQNIARARLNAIAGYDVSNTYNNAQPFWSEEMMYSCALWTEELGLAQKAKIHHVLTTARVKPGDRILEIGSRWCGFAIEAATAFGCTVDTARITSLGVKSSITVHLLDYRCLPLSFEKAFDAFVSIEMLEHVGTRHYSRYFQIVDWALKAKGSIAVISSSKISESRYTKYQFSSLAPDFSRYYVAQWPLPSPTTLIAAANKGFHGRLTLKTVENHGEHYPRTLREWKQRFKANMSIPFTLAFKRKWLYLFPSAEVGFGSGYLGCHMLAFGRDVL